MQTGLAVSLCLPRRDAAPPVIPSGLDVDRLLEDAARLGILPAVFNNLREVGLVGALGPESRWVKRHRENYAHNLAIQYEENRLREGLARAGVPCQPIKGVRLIELLYPDLSWRGVVDIDLLVPRDSVAEAYQKLREMGLRDAGKPWSSEALSRQIAQPPHAFAEVLLVTDHQILVELHWDWVGSSFPTGCPADDREAFLLYLCRHAAKHFWSSLQWVCDIELYLRKFGACLDWTRFWDLARENGLERSCAGSFHLCACLFQRSLRPEETRMAARSGKTLARQAADRLFRNTEPPWWDHSAWRLLKVYNWRQRISRCWRWLAPPPWHWSPASTQPLSRSGVWLRRYRRLLFQLAARLTPSAQWKDRLTKASDLSLRDWTTLAEATVTLLAIRVALRVVRFERLQRWAITVRNSAARTPEQTRDVVLRKAWLVEVAANHYFVPLRCLPRSLALVRILARRGIAADLKLGVRRGDTKLEAHAWVEWRGQVVNDNRRPAEPYAPLEPAASRQWTVT